MVPYQMPIQMDVPIGKIVEVQNLDHFEIISVELDLIESSFSVSPTQFISKNEIHLDQLITAQLLFTASNVGHVDLFIEELHTNAVWGPFNTEGEFFLSPIISGKDFVITAEFSNPIFETSILFVEDIVKFIPESPYESMVTPNHRTRTRELPVILVTGFWPPTNEMIRHFSQNESLNPNGWEGSDWEDRGYDVVSYFPEFETPDCDDCGMGFGDFEVDYQDTSQDYWPIVDDLKPIAIITFSRGWIDHSWEMEFNFYNRMNWYGDYETPMLPTPNPPDDSVANYFIRHSTLPVENVVDAINEANLGLDPYVDWNGNPGQFVSEFMGYHGVWYKDTHSFGDDACIIAGHIHVGGLIDWDTAQQAAEISIREIINYVDQFSYTSGDINDDGIVDILDIVLLVNAIMGTTELTTIQTYAADLNGDSNINIQDIILTINLILS
ncbi:MAG: hypothetical protein H8E72_07065 [Candidatus Marinimicrobia bacterium]|nr:hypothetical protein [Candidatus Neomarinimicrobiota bacterium]